MQQVASHTTENATGETIPSHTTGTQLGMQLNLKCVQVTHFSLGPYLTDFTTDDKHKDSADKSLKAHKAASDGCQGWWCSSHITHPHCASMTTCMATMCRALFWLLRPPPNIMVSHIGIHPCSLMGLVGCTNSCVLNSVSLMPHVNGHTLLMISIQRCRRKYQVTSVSHWHVQHPHQENWKILFCTFLYFLLKKYEKVWK